MTAPLLPSWRYRSYPVPIIVLWVTGAEPDEDAVTIVGSLAERLAECLSWTYEQTRLPDPEPEPEGPSSADLREWAQESRAVADAALRLANAIAWEADR